MEIPTLGDILAGIDSAIADCEATAPIASDADRKVLLASAADLRGLRERIAKEVPENLKMFQGVMEKLQTDGQQLLVTIEAQQAQLAAMATTAVATAAAAASAAPSVPAVPEESKVDLGMGAALRSDLLGKLFPDAKPADTFDPGKDIWQDWK